MSHCLWYFHLGFIMHPLRDDLGFMRESWYAHCDLASLVHRHFVLPAPVRRGAVADACLGLCCRT